MKLGTLGNPEFHAAVTRLLSQVLPGPTAYKLRKIVESLSKDVEHYNTTREDILKRHCIKNEDGTPKMENNNFFFDKEVLEELNRELNELGAVEVTHGSITLKELGDKFEMTGADALVLSDLIQE